MNYRFVAFSVAAGLVCALPVVAAEPTGPVVCPVMKYKLPSAKMAHKKTTHKGKTYYLCCAKCAQDFAKKPEKYTAKK